MRQRKEANSQTSPKKGTSPQISGSDTKSVLKNKTSSAAVGFLNDSHGRQPEIQDVNTAMTDNHSGDEFHLSKSQLFRFKKDL